MDPGTDLDPDGLSEGSLTKYGPTTDIACPKNGLMLIPMRHVCIL